MTTLQDLKVEILKINNLSLYRNSNSGDILSKGAQEIIAEIQIRAGGRGLEHLAESKVFKTVPNAMIASITDSVTKWGKCSEKQAYCLAKYAFENGVKMPEKVQ
jgi:hypothetical protein